MSQVYHPAHYNSGCSLSTRLVMSYLGVVSYDMSLECQLVINKYFFDNAHLAFACKYLWRCEFKGHHTQDLMKALFYLNEELERLEYLRLPRTAIQGAIKEVGILIEACDCKKESQNTK